MNYKDKQNLEQQELKKKEKNLLKNIEMKELVQQRSLMIFEHNLVSHLLVFEIVLSDFYII